MSYDAEMRSKFARALKTHAHGFRAEQIRTTESSAAMHKALAHAVEAGQLHRTTLGHRTVVYFATAEQARCAEQAAKMHHPKAIGSPRGLAKFKAQQAVNPNKVKVQHLPGFVGLNTRYAVPANFKGEFVRDWEAKRGRT